MKELVEFGGQSFGFCEHMKARLIKPMKSYQPILLMNNNTTASLSP